MHQPYNKTYQLTINTPKALDFLCSMPFPYVMLLTLLTAHGKYIDDENGIAVSITQEIKKELLRRMHWDNPNTLDHALLNMTKAQVLKRMSAGIYQINPYLSWKGPGKGQIAEKNFEDITRYSFQEAMEKFAPEPKHSPKKNKSSIAQIS